MVVQGVPVAVITVLLWDKGDVQGQVLVSLQLQHSLLHSSRPVLERWIFFCRSDEAHQAPRRGYLARSYQGLRLPRWSRTIQLWYSQSTICKQELGTCVASSISKI